MSKRNTRAREAGDGRPGSHVFRRETYEYFFPTLNLFYTAILKNASTSTLTMLIKAEQDAAALLAPSGSIEPNLQLTKEPPLRVWDKESARKQYKASNFSHEPDHAQIKLMILRNPAHRAASAWTNKFFMADSVERSIQPSESKMPTELSFAEVHRAFSRFLVSIQQTGTVSFLNPHLAPQALLVRDLSFYNVVVGLQHLDKVALLVQPNIEDALLTKQSVFPALNVGIKQLNSSLLSEENLKIIRDIYSDDYDLIRAAAVRFPEVNEELTAIPSNVSASGGVIDRVVANKLHDDTQQYHVGQESMRADRKANRKSSEQQVALYLLCHNERVLLPQTIQHYRQQVPNIKITILDNESDDGSAEIATLLGCDVISWDSGGEVDDHRFVELKNTVWKNQAVGWVIVADMDEWLCVTEKELEREARAGVTILRTLAWQIVAESERADLSDINLHALTRGFQHHNAVRSRDKQVCFRRPDIEEMNYGLGAHTANPQGHLVFSANTYVLKHMERLGLPWMLNKYKTRFLRAQRMQSEGIAMHYTDSDSKIAKTYSSSVKRATDRSQFVIPASLRYKVLYMFQRGIQSLIRRRG